MKVSLTVYCTGGNRNGLETDKYVIGVILTGVTFCPKPWQNSATHGDGKSQQQLLRWQRNPGIAKILSTVTLKENNYIQQGCIN